MARSLAQVAVEAPACLGADRGVGRKPRVLPLSAGGEAKAANEFSQHFHSVAMAAFHEAAESVAAKGARHVVVFNGVTASACPTIVEQGERVHPHAAGSNEGTEDMVEQSSYVVAVGEKPSAG
jgi:hypothetical protein